MRNWLAAIPIPRVASAGTTPFSLARAWNLGFRWRKTVIPQSCSQYRAACLALLATSLPLALPPLLTVLLVVVQHRTRPPVLSLQIHRLRRQARNATGMERATRCVE